MNKLKEKEVWVEINVDIEPQSKFRIVEFKDGGYVMINEIKKQSGYFHSKDQLEKIISDAWDQADQTADERAAYRYGRNGGFEHPDKQTFIDNLF